MEIENKTWVDAVKTLIGNANEKTSYKSPAVIQEETKGEFILPEKNSTFKHIFAYLLNSRSIEKEIVYEFVKSHKLYENKYGSCIFVGYDKSAIAEYSSIRSTNTAGNYFRGDVKNSDKSFLFCREGKNDTICVFESPIDLMSYLTLLKIHEVKNFDNHCISLGGVSDKALDHYFKEYPYIKNIVLCLDNDEAGHFACQQIREKYRENYKIQRHISKGKDFNEELKLFTKKIEQIKVSEVCESSYENKDEIMEYDVNAL